MLKADRKGSKAFAQLVITIRYGSKSLETPRPFKAVARVQIPLGPPPNLLLSGLSLLAPAMIRLWPS